MSVTRIASRYAKSLLDFSLEKNQLEQVHEDLATLRAAMKNRELFMLMKSPIIQGEKKTAILEEIFKGKLEPLTLEYLRLLVRKGRESYIPEIAHEFVTQYKELKKITSVRITSAAPLSDAVLDSLRNQLLKSGVTHGNLEIETHVDPELIGGFVLEFDNKRYDASAAQKLEELKAQFSKNLYIKEF